MPKEGHWLMSCYACGRQLRYPSRLARDPLSGEQVSVCGNQCAGQLYRMERRIARNDAALKSALEDNSERERREVKP